MRRDPFPLLLLFGQRFDEKLIRIGGSVTTMPHNPVVPKISQQHIVTRTLVAEWSESNGIVVSVCQSHSSIPVGRVID
jgi:hypothetical protein